MRYSKIRFVVASRLNRADFFKKTATGQSLLMYKSPLTELDLYEKNENGLSRVYNQSIERAIKDPAILVFIHDDVYLTDFFWLTDLKESLLHFDIIGVAGNKRRIPFQPSWAFIDTNLTPDKKINLSGIVGHGNHFPPKNLSIYGAPRQKVKLLDGLLLACHSRTLHYNDIRFDESFDFHFYDMDFCRSAEKAGLTMGTWNFSVIHNSRGNFRSNEWLNSSRKYFEKWGD